MDKLTLTEALAILADGDEKALRDIKMPWPSTENELLAIVRALSNRTNDYGTCVYAMSIAAEAAFNLIAHKLGVTGFQASCADMDIVRRTRHMDRFAIVNYENLLYPQYRAHFDKFRFETLLADPENREWLKEAATAKLAEAGGAHSDVTAHWRRLAAL